jgi:hypothetical protein
MKQKKTILVGGIALITIAALIMITFGAAAPAFSGSTLLALIASTTTPTPPPGDVIPIKPISGLTSLDATAKIHVNGLINGKRAEGDLNAVLTTNDKGMSRITVTGGLLGQVATQVGGSLVGLFTPSSVDIYKTPQGAYIVVNSLIPVCVKPADTKATTQIDDMSPQSLLGMLTSSDVARGRLVGQEKLNGQTVNHYLIDGDAFIAAAQKSKNPQLKAFGDALWSADDADLYVDAKGGYPVAFLGSYSGAYEPLKFEGDFDVQIELTGINSNTPVSLPASCNKPITP